MHQKLTQLVSLLALLVVSACGSTQPEPEPVRAVEAAAVLPWTTAFREAAVLLATDVTIEGPDDLVEHFAALQSQSISYHAETTEAGLLQVFESTDDSVIKVQLDQWEIAATRRVRVLRRPDLQAPVAVRAAGNVFWTNVATGAEEREATRTWTGVRGR